MIRLFSQHSVRRVIELPSVWNFRASGSDVKRMPVPCCIETHPLLSYYRGTASYQTSFQASGHLRLYFAGVSHTADILLDDQYLGRHYGAYDSFEFIVRNKKDEIHQLIVNTDNSFHAEASANIPNDYYAYGGITRPVIVEELPDTYLDTIHFSSFKRGDCWYGRMHIRIVSLAEEEKKVELQIQLRPWENPEDSDLAMTDIIREIDIRPLEEKVVIIEQCYPNINEYFLQTPCLYRLNTQLLISGQPVDDYIDRVGFREILVKGEKIFMNGKTLIIKGFNRHEDYADWGCTVPLQGMYRDISLIQETGANLVRTAHYPNDQRWLDLCDENGILVWEEGHARGLEEEHMRHPMFLEHQQQSLRSMIHYHHNHPSIIFWGLLNECCDYTNDGRSIYQQLAAYIRSLDTTRPVTYAANHFGQAVPFHLVDIVSLNMYPGWYTKETTAEFLPEAISWVEANGGRNKPILISETGAGAIYGYRDNQNSKWSEERQAGILADQLATILDHNRLSGVIIWQFADCRVDDEWFAVRPKTENNKGVLDRYRRKKIAFEIAKKYFLKNSVDRFGV